MINISEKDLREEFPLINGDFEFSVKPWYSRTGGRHFHWTEPVTRPLPLGGGTGKQLRKVFDPVPINRGLPLDNFTLDGFTAFLEPHTEIKTAMETEAEFTLGPVDDQGLLVEMIERLEELRAKPALLAKVLQDEKQPLWSVKLVCSKDVLDATGELTADAVKSVDTAHDWNRFGVAPERPTLREWGIGRPGLMLDTYLHVGEYGVIRQRGNFIEDGLMVTKGVHRRADNGLSMTRYCRQVACAKNPPVTPEGALQEGVAEMIYCPGIDFGDALAGDQPELAPVFQVRSERYRYLFSWKGSSPEVKIELSLDVSRGRRIGKNGRATGPEVVFCGFEFGLDHLGPTGAGDHPGGVGGAPGKSDSLEGSSSGLRSSSPSSHGLLSSTPVAVKDRVHDILDLEHPSIMSGNTFAVFESLVRHLTPYLCGDVPIRVAGEKAKSMLAFLEDPKSLPPAFPAVELMEKIEPVELGEFAVRSSVVEGGNSGFAVNTDYWYEIEDIDEILRLRLAQVEGEVEGNLSSVTATGIGSLRQFLQRELEELGETRPRTVLIPFNRGGLHWSAVAVTIDSKGAATARFADPMGYGVPMDLAEVLKAVYGVEQIKVSALLEQTDNTSCGPVTVENLVLFATGAGAPEEAPSMAQIRGDHVQLMRAGSAVGEAFDRRQYHNLPTVATYAQQRRWLQNLETRLDERELANVLENVSLLASLDHTGARNALVAAMTYDAEYEDRVAAHYRVVRTALFEAARELHGTEHGERIAEIVARFLDLRGTPAHEVPVEEQDDVEFRSGVTYEEIVATASLLVGLPEEQRGTVQREAAELVVEVRSEVVQTVEVTEEKREVVIS